MKTLIGSVLAYVLTVAAGCSALAAGIDELPPELAAAYNGVDKGQPVQSSAYRDWKPRHPAPWTIGYASSYAGNT